MAAGALTSAAHAAAASDVVVRQATHLESHQWDRFVLAHPLGTPFHLMAWKRSIEETFGYRAMYLAALDGDEIRGVLPLFFVENMLIGRALISSPFAVYGGILADSEETRSKMRDAVRQLGEALAVQYVELRNAYEEQCAGFARVSRYVTFTQEIGPDEKAILNAIPRKTRYMVRKALQEQFIPRQTRELPGFEKLYAASLRRLGTPSFPRRHFARLLANFGDAVDIREIRVRGKAVAAVMSFYFRDQVLPYYGASDPAFHGAAPNNFMYYDLMRWAGKRGYRLFDFGRSKKNGSGSYDFKSRWGMVERELPYEMLLVRRKSLPNYSPANSKLRLPIRIWQKLPLPVTRALGPYFLRLVP